MSLSSRTVNLALLTILVLEFLSGTGSLLVGTSDGRWVFWTHRAGAFALLVLLGWKARIILRSYRKRGLTLSTTLSGALLALLLATVAAGLLWASIGLRGATVPGLGALTGLGLHILLALLLAPPLLIHARGRWRQVRLRRADFASRRAALRYLTFGAVGVVGWRAGEALTLAAGWSGARRRFTGSREIGSLGGNTFPTTSWLTDAVPVLDPANWRLRIFGAVERELALTLSDLGSITPGSRRVVLDCTSGWYTVQDWHGISVAELLAEAGTGGTARSLVVHSATGYRRRYALAEAGGLLLATQVGAGPLTAGHGYPLRLVAPGWRGDAWVKWVVAVEVSEAPAWWQAPLPLQ